MAIQDDVNNLLFEMPRRCILFKSTTVLGDGSTLLGYNSDPNNAVASNTDGEQLLVYSPIGTLYVEDDGTMWHKTHEANNTWEEFGVGSGGTGGGSNTIEKHVLTRGAFEINMQSPSATFIPMQENSFAADTVYDDINYIHTMVLPYDTKLKRVVMRSTASASNKVLIGMHTNQDQPLGPNLEYKFFPLSAAETQEYTFSNNNESRVFTFTDSASAQAGSTLGISVSADGNVGMTNLSIVLEYDVT